MDKVEIKKIILKNGVKELEVSKDSEYKALWIGKNKDNLKTNIKITHKKKNLFSRLNIKAILFDESSFDMEADIFIDKGAKNTDTYLKAKVLILSKKAKARVVPSLEIKENQVKAGHSAIISKINESEIYYIMSRGLSRSDAVDLIINSFLSS